MITRELRREPRFLISRRGELIHNGNRFPCLIHDVSTRGIGITCARDPSVGQALELKFELYPGQPYQCKIEIRHIDNGCLGSEIIEVDQGADRMYRNFVHLQADEMTSKTATLSRTRTH
jgi:hypothetical protein